MRTLLLGDIGNRLDIADAEEEIARLRREHRRASVKLEDKDGTLRELQRTVAQQALAIQGLTRFLIDKGLVSAPELAAFITRIDAEDGQIDGQLGDVTPLPPPNPVKPMPLGTGRPGG